MLDFMNTVAGNAVGDIVASVCLIVVGAIVAWFVSLRTSWRLILSILRLARNGICNIYLRRDEYISHRPVPLDMYLKLAKRNFTYVGIYFSVATDQSRVDRSITALIDQGCRVRIVLLDQQASDEVIGYLEVHLGLAANSLRARVTNAHDHFQAFRASLAPVKRNLLSIHLHSFPLVTSAFLIDESEDEARMLVDIKWFSAGRESSTGIEFMGKAKPGSLFETLRLSFSSIINTARIV
jgi:hypothetical protein